MPERQRPFDITIDNPLHSAFAAICKGAYTIRGYVPRIRRSFGSRKAVIPIKNRPKRRFESRNGGNAAGMLKNEMQDCLKKTEEYKNGRTEAYRTGQYQAGRTQV